MMFPPFIRRLLPRLSRGFWIFQSAALANAVGTGMVLPFGLIYLHEVRGFGLTTSGLVISTFAAVSFVATTPGGYLVDRIGSRVTLGLSLVLLGLGYGGLGLADVPGEAFLAMAVAGVGNGLFWPSETSATVELVAPDLRQAAFGVQRAAFNVGLAAGGVVAGLLADTDDARSFTILFAVDAITFFAFAAVLPVLSRTAPRSEPETPEAEGPNRPGYRLVLRDRAFVGVVLLNAVLVAAGYAQFETTLPAFLDGEGLSERAIGLVFFTNMMVVAIAQLPVSAAIAGRRRMVVLAAATGAWAIVWLLVLGAGAGPSAGVVVVVALGAAALFGIAECAHGPIPTALAADLAPVELRGRYMAMITNSYALGFMLGPALGAIALGQSPAVLWGGAAALLMIAAATALALERRLPEAVR